MDIEFVGARKESYRINSRKPIVENATFEEDVIRRDFTINAMAISLNSENYGEIIDLHNGLDDLKNQLIRTPQNPDITFSDDPLRMMRGIRFAAQLNFFLETTTFEAIERNKAEPNGLARGCSCSMALEQGPLSIQKNAPEHRGHDHGRHPRKPKEGTPGFQQNLVDGAQREANPPRHGENDEMSSNRSRVECECVVFHSISLHNVQHQPRAAARRLNAWVRLPFVQRAP